VSVSLHLNRPSLARDPGPSSRHTGEFMVFADWSSVEDFAAGGAEERPTEWADFKHDIETKLMAYFTEKFPALAPLVVYRELGTPLCRIRHRGPRGARVCEGGQYLPRHVFLDDCRCRV